MLAIIVITYNNENQIADCIHSIYNSNISEPYQIILIDNASKDGSLEVVRGLKQENLHILENNTNLGFAGAVNQGLRYGVEIAGADRLFLLNPDATLDTKCVNILLNALDNNPSVGLLSPFIIQPKNGSLWFAGGRINWLKFRTEHAHIEQQSPRDPSELLFPSTTLSRKNAKANFYISGCALMITRKVIEKIGYFDENFFLYYEDADFSVRTDCGGFQLAIAPSAICFHNESQSSTSQIKTYHLVKSGLIFFKKHFPWYLIPYFWLIYLIRYLYHRFISKNPIVFQAISDFRKKQAN